MSRVVRDRTSGELADRVLALESQAYDRWDHLFGKKPWVVIGIVAVALCTGFWVYHTWQIERIDKIHQQEVQRITSENEQKIAWLKEQQTIKLSSEKDKSEIEIRILTSKLDACLDSKK